MVKGLKRPLLSRYASQSLNLINKVDTIDSEEYKNDIVNQYPDLFNGLGEIEVEYKINLLENSTPFTLTTPRKVPLPLLSKPKQEIGRMLEMGMIKRVDEPTDWCAPMVVVPKQDNKSGYVLTLCHQLTTLWAKLGSRRYPPRLMQIQSFGKENYQTNQNCSSNSSHHGVDIALRDCLMASLLAQSNLKTSWKKSCKA